MCICTSRAKIITVTQYTVFKHVKALECFHKRSSLFRTSGRGSPPPPSQTPKDKLAAVPRYARAPHNPYKLYGPFGRILLAIYTRFLVELWGRSLHNAMVSPSSRH